MTPTNQRGDGPLGDDDAARAIERVLLAERAAEASLAEARRSAAAQLEDARAEALAIVNRALDRIARWQAAHTRALDRRVGALRDEAAARRAAQQPLDDAVIGRAVDALAARLTGADGS